MVAGWGNNPYRQTQTPRVSGDVRAVAATIPRFGVQASSNLLDWISLPDALTCSEGWLLSRDAGATKFATRFYRLLER